ncbi:YkvA family protein [Candidatus Formimonas warabiya]|uniref:DUF1232 domain-containing protein n=1 Tax=Formimonas warabiya TaxID=1761012 RepID=A0A3G1KV85_FORW1|nr:YkvA family protein [Candidatus Formimonas warabiya]ATW26351.1 hypothetical protein DCMF_17700 [Candidatus Formimonas warabiya]
MKILEKYKQKARALKREIYVIYLAYKDPRVPLFPKILAACLLAYAFSPIDLIPDFVPVLGYLDDLLIIPLGITLVLRLIPGQILVEFRLRAQEIGEQNKPVNWAGAVGIIFIWLSLAALVLYLIK